MNAIAASAAERTLSPDSGSDASLECGTAIDGHATTDVPLEAPESTGDALAE